ncbi:MAG: saccharopine dehydrogenase NADP-binding domain-containing protein [Anaerolineales bacterium]
MKVFALGGYGKVGLPAIQLLAQSDLVTEIAIAGRSLERAEKAATEIGEKAIPVQADGADEQKLTSLVAGYDIIMNAAYDNLVLSSIRAAISVGTHYCDANVIIEQALQLSTEAASAGITSIVATGVSPNISNLMGVYVARQLEEVEQLQLGRADIYNFQNGDELTPLQWLEEPQQSLAALREFRQFIVWVLGIMQQNGIRTVRSFNDGRWVETDSFRSGLDVPLTQGGTISSYPYFVGDPLFPSLPRDLSTVSPVEILFSPFPPQLHDLLREYSSRVAEGSIDAETATNSFYETVESDPVRWLTLNDDFAPIPKMWLRAVGRKEGRSAWCSCWFTAPMWNVGGYFLTSVALAAAVRKILRGEIRERGVMAAETAFEPLPFFDEVVSLISDPPPDGRLIDESFEWME